MPLAAPIGSGLGIQNPANLRIMREQLPDAMIIVDAGVGTASDAAIAMELGADAVLMNTAIAEAADAAKMAEAMKGTNLDAAAKQMQEAAKKLAEASKMTQPQMQQAMKQAMQQAGQQCAQAGGT